MIEQQVQPWAAEPPFRPNGVPNPCTQTFAPLARHITGSKRHQTAANGTKEKLNRSAGSYSESKEPKVDAYSNPTSSEPIRTKPNLSEATRTKNITKYHHLSPNITKVKNFRAIGVFRGLTISDFGFRTSDFGLRISDFGFRPTATGCDRGATDHPPVAPGNTLSHPVTPSRGSFFPLSRPRASARFASPYHRYEALPQRSFQPLGCALRAHPLRLKVFKRGTCLSPGFNRRYATNVFFIFEPRGINSTATIIYRYAVMAKGEKTRTSNVQLPTFNRACGQGCLRSDQ